MEPNLNPDVLYALDVPDSAIVSPYELAFAMADDAAMNGTDFRFGEYVTAVRSAGDGGGWIVETPQHEYRCRAVVNCAGASSADLHNMICDSPLRMVHRRGQYYLLDRSERQPFERTIFQCPGAMGKGVLVSPTVHGNLLLGPTAEDISDPDLFHQRLVIDSLKFDLFLQGFDTFIAHYRDVMLSFFFVIMC